MKKCVVITGGLANGTRHIGMSLRVKQTDSRTAIAPVLDECRGRFHRQTPKPQIRISPRHHRQQLHAYTITHAIEDGNVLRFHIDYFKPEGNNPPKSGEPLPKKSIIECILSKHDSATGGRRFNAIFATASINDAIEYFDLTEENKQTIEQGDTVAHLYPKQISKLEIDFPSDLAEQQKIAECLSSVDELMAAQARKVDALKTHKKGLMQQLFPSLDGNTLNLTPASLKTQRRKDSKRKPPTPSLLCAFASLRETISIQHIASCLTSLDDLIAAQTQKLEALKTHKKGLMQQLFPSLEETP